MPGSAANEPGFERKNDNARPAAARMLCVPQSLALSPLFCVVTAFIIASGCPLSGASAGGTEDGGVLANGTLGDNNSACNQGEQNKATSRPSQQGDRRLVNHELHTADASTQA